MARWIERNSGANTEMTIGKIFKIFSDRRAMNNAVSATILTGAVIALSLAVFGWSQARSSDFSSEYSEAVEAETDRLKEKLVFEYIFYCNPEHNITVFLFNCGAIDDVQIKRVFVSKGGWFVTFPAPTLYSLSGIQTADQDLDIEEEGYLVLELSSSLSSGYYNLRVLTHRGASFDSKFVA
jgi:hypothetical protein